MRLMVLVCLLALAGCQEQEKREVKWDPKDYPLYIGEGSELVLPPPLLKECGVPTPEGQICWERDTLYIGDGTEARRANIEDVTRILREVEDARKRSNSGG